MHRKEKSLMTERLFREATFAGDQKAMAVITRLATRPFEPFASARNVMVCVPAGSSTMTKNGMFVQAFVTLTDGTSGTGRANWAGRSGFADGADRTDRTSRTSCADGASRTGCAYGAGRTDFPALALRSDGTDGACGTGFADRAGPIGPAGPVAPMGRAIRFMANPCAASF